MRRRYERYELAEFARLYYEEELSLRLVAARMEVDHRNLGKAAKRTGLVLRTHSEAALLAYEKGRRTPPNPAIEVDWETFRHHYYNLGETYAEIAPLLDISPQTLQDKAVERGYLSRRAAKRTKH